MTADLDKKPLDVAGLQEILQAVDPGVVLVSSRILERVIREAYALPNMYWNIPHSRSFVCHRQELFRHAEQADLELRSDQLLPETVILILKPDAEELSSLERPNLLVKYWRRLFHARIHLTLENLPSLNDDAIRERVEQIGRTEFEEIRNVLVEDSYLPPDPSERHTYIEFAAVYLELRYFASGLLKNFFPGLDDPAASTRVERLLDRDVNGAELFVKSRLRGATDPVQTPEQRNNESQAAYWKLVRAAQRAQGEKNIVRAAITRMRASRIAPAAQTILARNEAEQDIAKLTQRLADALHLDERQAADWTRHLTLLLDKADQGARPTEAAVLFELQNVCLAHEREVYTLDVVEWVTSMGKRPIKRPLPSQKIVRIIKHLRAASDLMIDVRLADNDRVYLTSLMQAALRDSERRLRARFAPVLTTAMEDVGLKPHGPLEQTAFDKMVDELLDRISRFGYLTFSELRDTISRNQLKLPDVSEPEHYLRGDPLIRLDRRLGSLLDGVYRPSEFYVRWLERINSLAFGTWWGRWVTRFVVAPFLLAWVVLFVLGLILEEVDAYLFHSPALNTAVQALMGPAYMPKGGELALATGHLALHNHDPGHEKVPWYWHIGLVFLAGFFLLAIFYNTTFRRRVLQVLRGLWYVLRGLIWDVPLRLLPISAIRAILSTWLFQLLYWYILKPAVATALIVFLVPLLRTRPTLIVFVFLAMSMLVNSRLGRVASEGIRDGLIHLGRMIRAGLIMGAVRFIFYAFKQISELIEYTLFTIDEWLRFRSGDGKVSLVARTILSLLWSPIAFVARFYMVVLIEPGINPLKLPISTVAAKIIYPLLITLNVQDTAVTGLSEVVGSWLAWLIVTPTIFFLPDAFGFLAWEMQENWSLYRSNRGDNLRPVVVGTHGETIRGLLQPGFHSGTVPHLFARLREAERESKGTQAPQYAQKVRQYKHEVEVVEGLLKHFMAREVIALLKRARCFHNEPIAAGEAHLATNRIRFEVTHETYPDRPVEIEIEHNHYWIVAGLRSVGWLEAMTAEQRRAFASCLAGMYKLADVDLIREQMLAAEGRPVAAARLTYEGVEVWRETHGPGIKFALRKRGDDLATEQTLRRFVFGRTPISWVMWQKCWREDSEGPAHEGLPGVEQMVLPTTLPAPPAPAASPEAHELLPDGAAPLQAEEQTA